MSNGLTLTSPAFASGATIPRRNGCQGEDLSPPLEWSGAPPGTVAFALTVDDRDAHGFVHWVVADLPGSTARLSEGMPASGPVAPPQGRNDFGRIGWGGPCPPPGSGDHRYVFTLFALSSPLGVGHGASAAAVRSAAAGKTLATAVLEGTYRR
jgi:Raf kinase inhibitor-like YbhB/YbcL family protein